MLAKEIVVGGLYTAKVNGRVVPVRVDAIREVRTETARGQKRWDVTNTKTGRKTTFRSAAKFQARVNAAALGSVNMVAREHYGVSEADLDYAYGVHGGSRVGGETPGLQLPDDTEGSPIRRPDDLPEKPAAPVAKATQRQTLRNRWGWVMVYESVEGSPTVTVRRSYRGTPAGYLTLSVEDARRHYWKNLYSNSFERIEGDL